MLGCYCSSCYCWVAVARTADGGVSDSGVANGGVADDGVADDGDADGGAADGEFLMLKLPLLENAVAGVAVAAKAAAVAMNCRCTIAASVTVVAVGAAVVAVVTLAVYAMLRFLSENLILSYLLLLSLVCRWSVVVDVVVDELVLQTVCEIRRKNRKLARKKMFLFAGTR